MLVLVSGTDVKIVRFDGLEGQFDWKLDKRFDRVNRLYLKVPHSLQI